MVLNLWKASENKYSEVIRESMVKPKSSVLMLYQIGNNLPHVLFIFLCDLLVRS